MHLDKEVRDRIGALLLEKPQQDPYKRFTILAYQLADVGKCMRYMEIYPDERSHYAAYLKSALADLVIQTIMVSTLYNFDIAELVSLGSERLDEFRKKGRYEEPSGAADHPKPDHRETSQPIDAS